MNVKINALSLKDEAVANELVAEANELIEKRRRPKRKFWLWSTNGLRDNHSF